MQQAFHKHNKTYVRVSSVISTFNTPFHEYANNASFGEFPSHIACAMCQTAKSSGHAYKITQWLKCDYRMVDLT